MDPGGSIAPTWNSRRSKQDRWRRSSNGGSNRRKIPSIVSKGLAPEDGK